MPPIHSRTVPCQSFRFSAETGTRGCPSSVTHCPSSGTLIQVLHASTSCDTQNMRDARTGMHVTRHNHVTLANHNRIHVARPHLHAHGQAKPRAVGANTHQTGGPRRVSGMRQVRHRPGASGGLFSPPNSRGVPGCAQPCRGVPSGSTAWPGGPSRASWSRSCQSTGCAPGTCARHRHRS
jgi:hypothetical protein